jgi:hypothetical protein
MTGSSVHVGFARRHFRWSLRVREPLGLRPVARGQRPADKQHYRRGAVIAEQDQLKAIFEFAYVCALIGICAHCWPPKLLLSLRASALAARSLGGTVPRGQSPQYLDLSAGRG